MKLKAPAWIVIFVAIGAVGFFSIKIFAPDLMNTLFPEKAIQPSVEVAKVPDIGPSSGTPTPTATPPVSGTFPTISAAELKPGCTEQPEVRWHHWYWNTHNGMILANGGPQSTASSKMCSKGINLKLIREDEVPDQLSNLVSFAQAYAKGTEYPKKGAAFVSFMGDGTAAILTEVNQVLEKLGQEYRAQIVGSLGYSRGEDCLMGPPEWKSNPERSRGGLTAAYLRDGDWNIAMKWLGDNGICNNPDESTYDPNCMNWVNAKDYIDAAQKYVANYCEKRAVVKNGKRTGKKKKVCVNGVATWTPGDNIAADNRGGLVRIVATDTYYYQMPNAVVGIRKWMQEHPKIVEGILEASFEANDEMRQSDAALRRASALAAKVYNEKGADAAYVYRYFKGTTEPGKQGLMVARGGSSVNNLADNCQLFGIQSCAKGSLSIFRATYETFGDIVVQQYPKLVPSYQPYDHVVDTSYLERIAQRSGGGGGAAELPSFVASQPVREVVSKKAWRINFDSGKSSFGRGADVQLKQLLADLVIAGSAAVEVHGHTDSSGDAESNRSLSETRAFAVKTWLQGKSQANFPEGRIRVFAHGEEEPTAPNTSAEGRAKNRRVVIVVGKTGT